MKHRFPLLASSASCLLAIGLLQGTAMARIYVADETLNQILIFPNDANGDTAPSVTISGSNTGLSEPFGVATDANYIYVANFEGTLGNSVTVYPIDASGNAAPVATIKGSNTGLDNCVGIAVDANYIYVVNESAVGYSLGSITVYPLTASGNVAPVATI
jgi:6-phosphogluconolactonase (cycloisomerase 2 family)